MLGCQYGHVEDHVLGEGEDHQGVQRCWTRSTIFKGTGYLTCLTLSGAIKGRTDKVHIGQLLMQGLLADSSCAKSEPAEHLRMAPQLAEVARNDGALRGRMGWTPP